MNKLREEANRIHAELDIAEREWSEWISARSRFSKVLAPSDAACPDVSEDLPDRGDQPAPTGPSEAAKPSSMVTVWRAGLDWSAMPVDYQRIRVSAGSAGSQERFCAASLGAAPRRRLWARFTTYVRHALARLGKITITELREQARLSFAKVAEYQKRGVIHFHAIVRIDRSRRSRP